MCASLGVKLKNGELLMRRSLPEKQGSNNFTPLSPRRIDLAKRFLDKTCLGRGGILAGVRQTGRIWSFIQTGVGVAYPPRSVGLDVNRFHT